MPEPAPVRGEIQVALDALDDLLTEEDGYDSLSVEDIDAVEVWANNVLLDIMRYRRLRGGRRG